MILGGLLKFLALLLKGLCLFLPTYTPPPAADLGAFAVIAWLVPINEIINLAAVLIALVTVSLGYVGVNWLINKARGSG